MYVLDPSKKNDPVIRWKLPDRIFFGHGACHILAGVYLQEFTGSAFRAFWIKPATHPGAHLFVSDGQIAFDYHGYSLQTRLEAHHQKVWTSQYSDWSARVVPVDFDLLEQTALNARNMRGPGQFLGDPLARARAFIQQVDHAAARRKVAALQSTDAQRSG